MSSETRFTATVDQHVGDHSLRRSATRSPDPKRQQVCFQAALSLARVGSLDEANRAMGYTGPPRIAP